MYAVIESGGKQYRVELGSEIEVDRLDVEPGQVIQLGPVLLVADGDQASIGQPEVDGATVSASVLRQDRGEKVVVFKYKPKARSRVKKGARADLTVLKIADIAWSGRSAAAEGEAAAQEQKRVAQAAEKAAAKQAAADAALAAQLAAAAAPPPEETAKPKRTRATAAARAVPEAAAPEAAAPEAAAPADAEPAASAAQPAADEPTAPAAAADADASGADDAPDDTTTPDSARASGKDE